MAPGKELFDYVLEAMKAEGKRCEPNRLYIRDGPLAAMNHLGSATLARNVRPSDVTAWLREVHKAGVKLQHPRAYLSAAFSRGMKAENDPTAEVSAIQFAIDSNPVVKVGGWSGVVPRDRAEYARAR